MGLHLCPSREAQGCLKREEQRGELTLWACSRKSNSWGSVEALGSFSTIRAWFKEGKPGALCPCPEAGKAEERWVSEVLSWGTSLALFSFAQ